MPALAQDGDEIPLDERVRGTAAESIRENLVDPGNPGQAQVSGMARRGDSIVMCATSDERNRNGTYIGRTYWEVTLNADGTEVLRTRDVTGTFSSCYGADYKPYRELLGQ